MIVLIYIDTSKQVGDPEHLKVFAGADAAETWSEENDPEGVGSSDLLAPALLRPPTSQCPSNIWLQAKRNSQFGCLHRRRARAAAEFGRYLITRDPTGHALKLGNLVIGPSAAVVTQRGTPCRNPKSPTSEKFPGSGAASRAHKKAAAGGRCSGGCTHYALAGMSPRLIRSNPKRVKERIISATRNDTRLDAFVKCPHPPGGLQRENLWPQLPTSWGHFSC